MQVTRPALRPCATCSTESPTMILKLQIMAALVLDHVPLQADDKYKDQYCELFVIVKLIEMDGRRRSFLCDYKIGLS